MYEPTLAIYSTFKCVSIYIYVCVLRVHIYEYVYKVEGNCIH